MIEIKKASDKTKADAHIVLFDKLASVPASFLNAATKKRLKDADLKTPLVVFDGATLHAFQLCTDAAEWKNTELLRKNAASIAKTIKSYKLNSIQVHDLNPDTVAAKAYCEGLVLSQYTFDKYLTDKKAKSNPQIEISIKSKKATATEIKHWNVLNSAVCVARDLVNEPNSHQTSVSLAEDFQRMGKESGFDVDVWTESKIQAQKMGGLLAVNRGSVVPPTFTIMEWKPENAKNKKPFVLIGKGIVYDTGGMSLKPTPMSMDYMKCDMAGSATVAAVIYAVAKAKLPIHLIVLVPATDNRPGEDAIVPGDVITMYNGNTVEVKNTDAEGRLVLADALHYAKKLKPELVVDFATLTGAAVRAIGPYASAIMGTASTKVINKFEQIGLETFEKLIAFPLWDEYADELKSDVADFSNLGKGEGGHMSAGKFLEKFTDFPWLHVDIAGSSFLHGASDYRTSGGTGVGVRLMFEYLKTLTTK